MNMMKAMVLTQTGRPLVPVEVPVPVPGPGQILIKIAACGVCRTELDQVSGRISPPKLPVIPGHQPVGMVAGLGTGAARFKIGDRVGAAWIFSACGQCEFCRRGEENLCLQFRATGSDADGGYAEYMVIGEEYAYALPSRFTDLTRAAPLMCSGVVGYRSLRLTGMADGQTLGLYGFGGAHHLVIQMANFLYPNSKKFVLSRNPVERDLAKKLGVDWVGDIDDRTPEKLDCAIDTTPAWKPVVMALENLQKGGRLVINVIRKEETDKDFLLKLDYAGHLWMEKIIKSVANVTRCDAVDFLALAARAPIEPEVQVFPLAAADEALAELKAGKIRGSKVLRIGG
jgi:alcohol dehydrogenase, propanol-preferring